jgi:hypothetical protein
MAVEGSVLACRGNVFQKPVGAGTRNRFLAPKIVLVMTSQKLW